MKIGIRNSEFGIRNGRRIEREGVFSFIRIRRIHPILRCKKLFFQKERRRRRREVVGKASPRLCLFNFRVGHGLIEVKLMPLTFDDWTAVGGKFRSRRIFIHKPLSVLRPTLKRTPDKRMTRSRKMKAKHSRHFFQIHLQQIKTKC